MLLQQFAEKDTFIERCIELSENVDNYINNKLYLADVEDPKFADQLYLRTQCLDIILEELADRGIIFPNNAQEFQELLYDREIPLQLRERFEEDKFFNFIRNLTDESKQALRTEFEYDDEQLCARVCNVMSGIYPTDAAWGYLASHDYMFTSNEDFRKRIFPLVEKAAFLPPPPPPIESDVARIAKWMAGEKEHQDELKTLLVKTVERIYNDAGDNESSTPLKIELLKKMERYDWDHRTPAFIAKMMANPNAEQEDELNHQQRNDHHIQYYYQHSGITWPQIVMVACTAASKSQGDALRVVISGNENADGVPQITQEDIKRMADVLNVAETVWNEMKQAKEASNGETV